MNQAPHGIIVPLVTPFDAQQNVDEAALRRIINHVIDGGVHGVFVAGTTSEFYALSPEEHSELFRIAVDEVRGRVPVYAGATGVTTRDAVHLTELAEQAGVDAVSVLTPYFISLTQEELYRHYKTIAESTSLPVILYDNKPKTNLTLKPATVERLAQIKNIVAMKDSTGDLTNTVEILRRTRHQDDFHVLMGRDSLIFAALCSGVSGAVAACANVAPRLVADIYDKFIAGEYLAAREAQFELVPLRIAFSLGSFPAVIMEALHMIGVDAGACKLPTGALTDDERTQLRTILTQMKLLQ